MPISDWISDVCSSDLVVDDALRDLVTEQGTAYGRSAVDDQDPVPAGLLGQGLHEGVVLEAGKRDHLAAECLATAEATEDRREHPEGVAVVVTEVRSRPGHATTVATGVARLPP